ncbi:oligoendopeptidase F family protein [Myxococcota bacterium]|nr:oligoendopeptidase F family protein [Myxococcota bacterium]
MLALLLTLPLALANPDPSATAAAPPVQDTWDLSALYPSVEAWTAAMDQVRQQVDALSGCRGQLDARLEPCLVARDQAHQAVAKLHVYASNHSNVDTRDDAWLARAQQAELLYIRLDEVASFYEPELLSLGGERIESALAATPGLSPFDHQLRSLLRRAPHVLDPAQEELLAAAGTLMAAPPRLHTVFVNGELPWPQVTLSDGSGGRLDPAHFAAWRGTAHRGDRQVLFSTFLGALQGYTGTLAGLLDTAIQGHWLAARTRGYDSSLEAALAPEGLPTAVYETLVARTRANLPTLHRYLRLRARMLGVDDLAYSDLYTPLVHLDRTWTLEQAKALSLSSSKPLGRDYVATMAQGFDQRWMDAYPAPGKVGGAYMDGAAYGLHPFVLMNYTGDYESVSTLAHEWGHALHSVLSSRAQPFAKADYSTFVAEIASTFNEDLLLATMLDGAKTDEERLFYLGSRLESLRTTYFRQALFAELELRLHQQVERGEPLTGDGVSATYLELVRAYYGAEQGIVQVPPETGAEWAFIPHFYYDFYVWQYATSIAASSLLSQQVRGKEKGALDRYLGLLSAGGSDDPLVLLGRAGVDMTSPAPYDALAAEMERIMDQMEAILARQEKKQKGR